MQATVTVAPPLAAPLTDDAASAAASPPPPRARSTPRLHAVRVVRATLPASPVAAVDATAAAAAASAAAHSDTAVAAAAASSASALDTSPVVSVETAALSSPSPVAATPPRRLSGLRIHTASGSVLAGAISALALLSPPSHIQQQPRSLDAPVPVATLQLPTLASPPAPSPAPVGPSSPLRPPAAESLQSKFDRAVLSSAELHAAAAAVTSAAVAADPLPQPQPIKRSPPSKLQKPRAIVKVALPAPAVEAAVAAVAEPAPSPRRSASPGASRASPLRSPPSPSPRAPSPSASAATGSRAVRPNSAPALPAPSCIGSPPPKPAGAAKRRSSDRHTGREASASPSAARPTVSSTARAASPAVPRLSHSAPVSPRPNQTLQRAPSPNRPAKPRVALPMSPPPAPAALSSKLRKASGSPAPPAARKRTSRAPTPEISAPPTAPNDVDANDSESETAAAAAAEEDADDDDAETEETEELVEIEVDSEGEEIEVTESDEATTEEEDDDDAEEEENSVPNRRPVDILDALYEDVDLELEESLTEMERREQRRQARRAAGSRTPEAKRRHKAEAASQAAAATTDPSSAASSSSPAAAVAPAAAASAVAVSKRIRLNPFQRTKSMDHKRTAEPAASSPVAAATSLAVRPLPLSEPPWLWDVPTPFDPLWFPRFFNARLHEVNFAFGSNMNAARMVARQVRFEGGRGFSARLPGWQLCFPKTADSLGDRALSPGAIGYASLTPSTDPSVCAYGVGYIVWRDHPGGEPGGLARLDEFEGTALDMYARTKVTLQVQNGEQVEAIAYISCPGASAPYPSMLRPTRSYMNHLLCGSSLLPASYMALLQSWELSWMPDPVAHVAPEQALLVSEPTNAADLTEEQRSMVEEIKRQLDAKAHEHAARAQLDSATAAAASPTRVPASSSSTSSIAALRAKLSKQAGFHAQTRSAPKVAAAADASASSDASAVSAPRLVHATLHRSSRRPSRRPQDGARPTFQPLLSLGGSDVGRSSTTSLDSFAVRTSAAAGDSPLQSNGAASVSALSPRPSARLHPSAAAAAAAVPSGPAGSYPVASVSAPPSVLHALDSDSMPPLVKPKPRGSADKEGLKRRMAKLQQHLQQQQEQIRAKMNAQQQMQQAQAALSPVKPPTQNSAAIA